jgi:hypothetical protein
MKCLVRLILVTAAIGVIPPAVAEQGDWQVRTDLQALYGPYEDSEERDDLANVGVFLHFDYLEQGGISLGYNRTMVGFRNSSADIDQDQLYLSGRYSMTPDWARGRIGFRIDGHRIDNNDDANGTGDLTIVAPQLSYINLDETFYADIGYASSSYGDALALSGDLTVDQLTPTIGFGFNDARDWIQIRGYLIDYSNPVRAQGISDSIAVEAKWTHGFEGRGILGLEKLVVTGLGGERLYAVDPDSAVLFNVADVQKAGAALAGQWRFDDQNQFVLQAGFETYTNEAIADDYDSLYLYLNFTHIWK